MHRLSRLLRCDAVAAAIVTRTSISDAFRQVQKVWNVDFKDGPVTTRALTFNDEADPAAPIFHVLDLDGRVALDGATGKNAEAETVVDDGATAELQGADGGEVFRYRVGGEVSVISRVVIEHMLRTMLVHNTMDKIMLEAQRQGRISFYMTMFGEEAAVIGAAAGLASNDELFLQYRESGILTYRGYTIPEFIAQCMGNCECDMKGRQMPIHYGSKRLHVQMVSSPLATQIPHGAGAGYAFRLENEALQKSLPPDTRLSTAPDARISAVFFGEGAASEGDFHAGLNFAATMGSHALFFVRNNGYAISTPTHNQYMGDGILGRAVGYGLPAARVDGADALAVYHTVRKAREMILDQRTPVLIEALAYRVSHHSTSDDSTAYRARDEIEYFTETFSPIARFERFVTDRGWWTPEQSQQVIEATRKEVLSELRRQEKLPPWPVTSLCDDVFENLTPELERQKAQMMAHYAAHKEKYDQEKL
ncbi:putative 2-oxoisovalerate dehydrogenase alpha subunit [Leptomonas pyrrhocoris]|uniref:2-oxoisovalerate dehydrogenase subunit alpha n=1 Tax=Leptomonas pyrrhocoris TaxID=157538 RepID=A0A0N0DUC0_LEPPY|nr:putative 2-oxoisovalerate dehydrogenase alpha subunit [Leptomonas pyrrhocoris]XP_015656771.1 putative 2-oxoisovalerate dehydrogenase alpha subunit [Leptomonas pyrrhocoris]KPA78331.1 putative 2-oxoisovalerate dehydrogenase alpha subunit [Leptomonas pyrrhocoris]KPA78332.1 putative 2-oxoisovalerate dehydrogenase alpha subunit [Leptomonas pyrrhocoris]|eukprot:XP_015656770.1 putative 2-oxoisovalerate dehydrogenase alpha subunit [Leptomonas pyrrhocoris]